MSGFKRMMVPTSLWVSAIVFFLVTGLVAYSSPSKLPTTMATMISVLGICFLPRIVRSLSGYDHMANIRCEAQAIGERLQASEQR